jgi:hypothetical protein
MAVIATRFNFWIVEVSSLKFIAASVTVVEKVDIAAIAAVAVKSNKAGKNMRKMIAVIKTKR